MSEKDVRNAEKQKQNNKKKLGSRKQYTKKKKWAIQIKTPE